MPESIASFLTITEIDQSDFFITNIFRRKFGHIPPDFPRHFAAFYRSKDGANHVAGYSHMRKLDSVYLSGGSCSDGDVIRMMSPQERSLVDAAGGVWFQILKYKFAKLGNDCEAFFGHCGDARALKVALAAGFVPAGPLHLIVNWHLPITDGRKQQLVERVNAIGAF